MPTSKPNHDPVNHPVHYTAHPSGVECIQITEWMNFCVGNAVKYLWRADLKNGIQDLEKAAWYIAREIERRKALTELGEIIEDSRNQELVAQVREAEENVKAGKVTWHKVPVRKTAARKNARRKR